MSALESYTSSSGGFKQCAREKFWEELTPDEKLEKIAQAVELLGRWFSEAERDRHLMSQHSHSADGKIVVPLQHNQEGEPWYKSHLLNRKPGGM